MKLFGWLWQKLFRSDLPAKATPEGPRIDFLLGLYHGWLEEPNEAYGGLNFLGLVEKHVAEGRIDLAIFNLDGQVDYCVTLANLYWGQGQMDRASAYLRQAIERHERRAALCAELGLTNTRYADVVSVKCAALLLDLSVDGLADAAASEAGYDPWFKDAVVSACLFADQFDLAAWQANSELWTKRRFPKYRLAELDVYVKALTGQYPSTEAMFDAHRRMFAGRAKRPNAEWAMLDGYQDNDLIIDHIFAAILQRIGWQGIYRHSWPNTHHDPAFVHTDREPDSFLPLGHIVAKDDKDGAVIANPASARQFIDRHLARQIDERGMLINASRPARDGKKIAVALEALDWTADPDSLHLMQSYRMDLIQNDSTNLILCDPICGRSFGLGAWTRFLVDDFGLHPDFIALAASEDKRDYRDPQGAWYVYWKADRRIYAVQREDWDRPTVATTDARIGLTLWPSYVSFVAWWVAQHRKSAL